jgi:hypothetical protein
VLPQSDIDESIVSPENGKEKGKSGKMKKKIAG